jgi:hypothetical protein
MPRCSALHGVQRNASGSPERGCRGMDELAYHGSSSRLAQTAVRARAEQMSSAERTPGVGVPWKELRRGAGEWDPYANSLHPKLSFLFLALPNFLLF